MATMRCEQCKELNDTASNWEGGMYKGHYFCGQNCRSAWVKEQGGGSNSGGNSSTAKKVLGGALDLFNKMIN